jgi:hypothetical protein
LAHCFDTLVAMSSRRNTTDVARRIAAALPFG